MRYNQGTPYNYLQSAFRTCLCSEYLCIGEVSSSFLTRILGARARARSEPSRQRLPCRFPGDAQAQRWSQSCWHCTSGSTLSLCGVSVLFHYAVLVISIFLFLFLIIAYVLFFCLFLGIVFFFFLLLIIYAFSCCSIVPFFVDSTILAAQEPCVLACRFPPHH